VGTVRREREAVLGACGRLQDGSVQGAAPSCGSLHASHTPGRQNIGDPGPIAASILSDIPATTGPLLRPFHVKGGYGGTIFWDVTPCSLHGMAGNNAVDRLFGLHLHDEFGVPPCKQVKWRCFFRPSQYGCCLSCFYPGIPTPSSLRSPQNKCLQEMKDLRCSRR
jgi:hypothetical protein